MSRIDRETKRSSLPTIAGEIVGSDHLTALLPRSGPGMTKIAVPAIHLDHKPGNLPIRYFLAFSDTRESDEWQVGVRHEWANILAGHRAPAFRKALRGVHGKHQALEPVSRDHSRFERLLLRSLFVEHESRRTSDDESFLNSRIVQLKEIAAEEYLNVSSVSEESLRSFIEERELENPSLFLTPDGEYRAIWKRDNFSIELDFRTDGRASILYSRFPPKHTPGRYAAMDEISEIANRWADIFNEFRIRK